ncbi:uncharacterized protein LOC109837454 [Asparagus officinalis]|uniref:uncharacterized protein LOC109837454 n=1 Tax=Asparagus officinalis TaxID=4686 RepID=UPI00098E7D3E|nr:uncharacterized protein LOC109837454 [Asparagus officinalis]
MVSTKFLELRREVANLRARVAKMDSLRARVAEMDSLREELRSQIGIILFMTMKLFHKRRVLSDLHISLFTCASMYGVDKVFGCDCPTLTPNNPPSFIRPALIPQPAADISHFTHPASTTNTSTSNA